MGVNELTLDKQKDLVQSMDEYNKVADYDLVKRNINKYMKKSQYYRQSQRLADLLGIDKHTLYLYKQPAKRTNHIPFLTMIKMADAFEILVTDFFKDEDK